MKATILGLAAFLVATTAAHAQPNFYCWSCQPPRTYPQAPDACGGGFFCTNAYGGVYGPNYHVRPSFAPYSGIPPFAPGFCKQVGFPTHPYARSPRDFFMTD